MTSEYFKVFQQRLTSDGFSYKEQVQNLARRNFDNYIAETPTSVVVQYENESYKVSIVENKQDEYRLSKQMLSSIYDYFPIGSLIHWEYFNPKEAPENYWIVWRIQQNSIQDHNVSYISRCNHKLKWIDEHGVRHEQYVYEFSSKENMIRATFKSRVQEIIASEPNKFMEIIMPFTEDIKREQRFIVDGEAWYVIEFDSSSVDGITYITLGEDKKDLQQDLLIKQGNYEDLANYDNEGKKYIGLIDYNPIIQEYSNYLIHPFYFEDGIYIPDKEFDFYINNQKVYTGQEYNIFCEGATKITAEIKLLENPLIKTSIEIISDNSIYNGINSKIIGNSKIKWGQSCFYNLQYIYEDGLYEYLGSSIQVLNNSNNLATVEYTDDGVLITANSKRKVGNILLQAYGTNGNIIRKVVEIVSLW